MFDSTTNNTNNFGTLSRSDVGYDHYYYRNNLSRIRLSLLLPSLLFIFFLLLDYILIFEHFFFSLSLRLICVTSSLFCLAWSYHSSYQQYWQVAGTLCAIIYIVVISIQSFYTTIDAHYIYPISLLLGLFWLFLLSRIYFTNTVLGTATFIGIFIIGFLTSGKMPIVIFTSHMIYLFAACFLGGISAYFIDRADRRAYAQDRRLAEMESIKRRSDEQFKTVLNNMPAAVFLRDVDGRILLVNEHYEQIYSVKNNQTIGKKLAELFPPEMAEEYSKLDRQVHEVDGEIHSEHNLVVDGEKRYFNSVRFPIPNEEGSISGIGGIELDITERKAAEEDLRIAKVQAEEALSELKQAQARLVTTEKMASLGQLTAGIAHEIKNPLNFVNNFSETSVELLDELHEAVGPVQEHLDEDEREDVEDIFKTLKGDLQKIQHHGSRADGIVKSMLLHSRGDAAEQVTTSVNGLVKEAVQLAYHGERARDKAFQATLEEEFGNSTGEADLVPQEITRVLVNLLSNAFYAVTKRSLEEESGDYEPTVSVTTLGKEDSLEIKIRDNGIGIPSEVRDKLFEPFFTTKPTGEGTGLGLSMCFDIVVQKHGGDIVVDSAPGEFTEFALTLPRRAPMTVQISNSR